MQENVAFRVLAAGNRLDHRTICRFRAQHAEALRGLFQQVLDVCMKEGLVPGQGQRQHGKKSNQGTAGQRAAEGLGGHRPLLRRGGARIDREEDELYSEENDGFSLPEKLLADAGYFYTKEVDGVDGTELCVATKSRRKAGPEEFLPIVELGGRPTTKQAMDLLICTTDGRATYSLRGQTVEPAIGQLKDRCGMREFHMRGIEKTKTEALLASMGNNTKKLWRNNRNYGSSRNRVNATAGQRPAGT